MDQPKLDNPPVDSIPGKSGDVSTPTEMVQVDKGEFERLKAREKELLRDYHTKTTQVARDRDAIKAEKDTLAQAKADAAQREAAFLEDLDFFSNNPPDKWAEYKPKVAKFNIPSRNPNSELEGRVGKLEQGIEFLVSHTIDQAADADSNRLLKYADQAIEKWELASERALLSGIREFQRENNRYPTHAEVMGIAEDLHKDLARKGVKVEKPSQPAVDQAPMASVSRPTSIPSQDSKPQFPDLRRFKDFEGAAERWLAGRQGR